MNLDNVNKQNTKEWCKFNENSKGELNRQEHIKKYGGSWEKNDKNQWIWNRLLNKIVNFVSPKKERMQFEFVHKDGKTTVTDNFTAFCRENNINSSAMHEVLSGKRKQFKGYTVKRIPPKDNGKNT